MLKQLLHLFGGNWNLNNIQPRPGYLVSQSPVYERGHICHFVNEKKHICKLLIGPDYRLHHFPGCEKGDWAKYYSRPVTASSALRVDIRPPDEQDHTKVTITIQWADRGDDGGFGMDDDCPEITLYSTLDDRGNYLHPFRLNKLSW